MKKPLWAVLELPLKVTKEVLWSVLTEPQHTEKYMYNCKLKCNWEIGDEVQWVEVHEDGSETTITVTLQDGVCSISLNSWF